MFSHKDRYPGAYEGTEVSSSLEFTKNQNGWVQFYFTIPITSFESQRFFYSLDLFLPKFTLFSTFSSKFFDG